MADDATATSPIAASSATDPTPDTTAQQGKTKSSDAPLGQANEESSGHVEGDEGDDSGECLPWWYSE